MSNLTNPSVPKYERRLKSSISKFGLITRKKISSTLQGSIWRALRIENRQKVVVKVTNRVLHNESVIIINGKKCAIHENIFKEKQILKYLTIDENAPKSIVKYNGFFKSDTNYFLVMEDAGNSLFQFVVRAHEFINAGKLDISEWQRIVKIIFKQIIECIDYIHSKNVAHFDISLENFLINDVNVTIGENDKINFCGDDIQIKICDFGVSEIFERDCDFQSSKWCGKTNYKSPEIHKKERFCAKSNDIWCVGICLFMLLIGGSPWFKATESDDRFIQFMKPNGFQNVLTKWDKLKYVNDDLIDLLEMMLKSEGKRATVNQIKKSPFLQ